MPALSAIRVRGLRDMQVAFAAADKELAKELRLRLKAVAEPVRADAERLAGAEIRNIGEPWAQMRVGVTRNLVYVAPSERGRRTKTRPNLARPNLAGLLMDRAMSPALEQNEPLIEREVGDMLDDIGRHWERRRG